MVLKEVLKRLILKNLPKSIITSIKKPLIEELESVKKMAMEKEKYINISFSQEGEDLVLYRLLEHKHKGFYIDVGAHHPLRFSNTYKFYLLGWRGINIDPLPGSMDIFKSVRERDINLEVPILNDTSKSLLYYMFDEPALNTFDQGVAISRDQETKYNIVDQVLLKPYKLSEILFEYLPAGQEIDFISIDVEGKDLEVLQSNDWVTYRPSYIVIESIATNLMEDMNSAVNLFLNERGYELNSKTANSLIYKKNA